MAITRSGPRSVGLALLVLFLSLAATACSPPDEAGVEVAPDGSLVARNCGTSIHRIDVTDAQSGREIWSAHATESDSEPGLQTRGRIKFGTLPGSRWVGSEYRPTPEPEVWRVELSTFGPPTVIDLTAEKLEPGRVYRPDGTSVAESRFYESVCNSVPLVPLPGALGTAAIGGVLLLGAAAFGWLILGRGRSRSAVVDGVNLALLPPPPDVAATTDASEQLGPAPSLRSL